MSNDLVLQQNSMAMMPVMDIGLASQRYSQIVKFVKELMIENSDYGTIPGTEKPTLLKPGAEKLTTFFGLTKKFEIIEKIEDWTGRDHGGEPFFYYLYRCRLLRGDLLIAESDGSCNSMESKYRWRWVGVDDIPNHLDPHDLACRKSSISEFEFAINKRETGGKYGKPAEYWDRFEVAIAAGDARQTTKKTAAGKELAAWEISSEVYRVPNPDIASQVNTIQKMAQKRALIASTLLAINASEFFTQDIEDMDFIETSFVEVSTQPQNPVSHKKVQPTRKPKTGPLNGFPDSPAKLLEYVNNKIQVPYDNLSHLLNSLKSESGHDDWMWPGQSDSAGWQLAYELAKQHAEAKLGNADQLGFDTPQPSAGAAYAN